MVDEALITKVDDLRKDLNLQSQKTNDKFLEIIKDLEKGWWVPVEERLPEKDKTVLLSLENGDVIIGYNHYGTWMTKTCEDSVAVSGVEAWMPKPSAYSKGEKKHHHKK